MPVPDLSFAYSARSQAPITGLVWDSARAGFRVFEKTGREIFVGMGRTLAISSQVSCNGITLVSTKPNSSQVALLDSERSLTIPGESAAPTVRNVRDLKWSPCGRYLAIFHEGTVAVWNPEKRKLVSPPPELVSVEDGAWRSLSSHHAQLALATPRGICLWSADGSVWRQPKHWNLGPSLLLWNPTGSHLAVAIRCGGLSICAPEMNRVVELSPMFDRLTPRLAWGPNAKTLTAVAANMVFIWNLEAIIHGKTKPQTIRRFSAPVACLESRPHGSLLATGDFRGEIQVWHPARAECEHRIANVGSPVSHMGWSPNGNHLAAGTMCGGIYIARVRR